MTEKELKSLLKVLRSQGVSEYHTHETGFSIKLSEEVPQSSYKRRQEETETVTTEAREFADLTYEEQLFYSSEPPQVEPTETEEP